jgi:all-trans-retinol 13,14-reductase
VSEIRIREDRIAGVRLQSGESIDATLVISAAGAHNTVAVLAADVAPDWRKAVESLKSGMSYVSLYLGFNGDIRAHGATPANVWNHRLSCWRLPNRSAYCLVNSAPRKKICAE